MGNSGESSGIAIRIGFCAQGRKTGDCRFASQNEIPLNVPFIADNEIDIYGIFRYANTYPKGIEFLASGIVDTKHLVTDQYSLEQTQEAMERALQFKNECLKVMVYPNR